MSGGDYLDQIKQELELGHRQWKLGYKLLNAFGYVRRRQSAIDQINQELNARGMLTTPAIDSDMPLDSYITFQLKNPVAAAAGGDPAPAEVSVEAIEAEELQLSAGSPPETALSIGNLEAAERVPAWINPNATLSEAFTRMELNGYSQLVVATSDLANSVKGTISYESITRAFVHGAPVTVADCVTDSLPAVDADEPLLDVVKKFEESDAVLITSKGRLSGIVTRSDIAGEFNNLAAPFLLIGEIERRIRWLIACRLEESDYLGSDDAPIAKTVSDLSLGEMQRVLESEPHWQTIGLPYDRATLIKELDQIRLFRNRLMHFREPLQPEEIKQIRAVTELLRDGCSAIEKAANGK